MLTVNRLIWVAILAFPLWGQELRVPAAVLSRGDSGSLSIQLSAPPDRAPAALQWDLVFPIGRVDIQDSGWSAGPSAVEAGKQLMCARQLRKNPEAYAYKCMLVGGRAKISNGAVAVVKIKHPQRISGGRGHGPAGEPVRGIARCLPPGNPTYRKYDHDPIRRDSVRYP